MIIIRSPINPNLSGEPCDVCGTTGKVDFRLAFGRSWKVKCRNCHGLGIVNVVGACTHCHGTKTFYELGHGEVNCTVCGGSGLAID